MRRIILNLLAALGTLLWVPPATATTEFLHYSGGSAYSLTSVNDPGGCIRTDVTVNAYERLAKSGPGPFEETPGLMVNIDKVDWCSMTWLLSAFGESTDVRVVVDRAMRQATVEGSVEAFDYVGGMTHTIDVDLTWTGSGALAGSRDNNFYYGPHTRSLARGFSRHRDAQVAGSVLFEGTNIVAGWSGNGQIWFEQGSLVTINHALSTVPGIPPTQGTSLPSEFFMYRGGSAGASFVEADLTGCITTEIFVGAGESRERYEQGAFEPVPWISMNLDRIDWCSSTYLMMAHGSAIPESVQITNALKGAEAKGRVELYDSVQGTSFEVDIDVAWTATGPLSGHRDHFSSDFPDSRWMSRENIKSRDARASGTVLREGINLLPGPSQQGTLLFGQGMEIRWPQN